MIRKTSVVAVLVSFSMIAAAGTPKLSGGIENRRWRIAKYRADDNKRKDEKGLVEAKHAEITFSNGHIQGSPGCGSWVGTYELAGNKLNVHIAGTYLAGLCSSAENGMVEFKGELRIEVRKDRVYLRDERGKAQLMLVPY